MLLIDRIYFFILLVDLVTRGVSGSSKNSRKKGLFSQSGTVLVYSRILKTRVSRVLIGYQSHVNCV